MQQEMDDMLYDLQDELDINLTVEMIDKIIEQCISIAKARNI
jgi:hypothetical protein